MIERGTRPIHVREKSIVGSSRRERLLDDGSQQQDGVALGRFPKFGIQTAEQVHGVMVPTPAQVIGNVQQPTQSYRQGWNDMKSKGGLHLSRISKDRRAVPAAPLMRIILAKNPAWR